MRPAPVSDRSRGDPGAEPVHTSRYPQTQVKVRFELD